MVVGISFIYLNDLSNCNDLHIETIFKRDLKFTSENVMSTVEIVFIFWYNFSGKGCNSHCSAITVFSYLFHFFRLKEQQYLLHVGQINLIPSKTTLTKVTFWRKKWIPFPPVITTERLLLSHLIAPIIMLSCLMHQKIPKLLMPANP